MTDNIFSLVGRKILVTGGNGHLGKAIIAHLLSEGAQVYSIDVEGAVAEDSTAIVSHYASLEFFRVNLELASEREAFVAALSQVTHYLDGIVHCAAFVGTSQLQGWSVPPSSQTTETWRSALEVNLTAPFHLTQLLIPLLNAAENPSVIGIGSIYGHVGPDWRLYEDLDMANPAAYAASKGGLSQLFRWFATSLAPKIRVNVISPGGISRAQPLEFKARYVDRTPLRRMATEGDIIGAVVFLLSDASSYVTGQDLVIDGGFTTW